MNDQWQDKITERVERMIASGANREDIKTLLLNLADQWTAKSGRSSAEREQRKHMLGRLGAILHYFCHGYPGDGATAEDLRIIDRIQSLPKSP